MEVSRSLSAFNETMDPSRLRILLFWIAFSVNTLIWTLGFPTDVNANELIPDSRWADISIKNNISNLLERYRIAEYEMVKEFYSNKYHDPKIFKKVLLIRRELIKLLPSVSLVIKPHIYKEIADANIPFNINNSAQLESFLSKNYDSYIEKYSHLEPIILEWKLKQRWI